MCGIAGFVRLSGAAPRPVREVLGRMLDRLHHRGPDGVGHHVEGAVAFGARRLAVIDPHGGDQPLCSADGRVVAVFNGEIYNHRALRRGLEDAGHDLTLGRGGASDGAVVPHLVEAHGMDFVSRLDGMFALAAHDVRRHRLILARDPMGIKPLYWTRTASHLIFASELPAILASGLVEPRLDRQALAQLVAWEHVPTPRTLFADISKLPAGHRLVLDLATGRIVVEPFWTLPSAAPRPGDPTADGEWLDTLDAAIRRAVRRQLDSDVPLGVLLSGGIDSSLVAAAAAGARPHLDTFTLATGDASYDESPYARQVAEHLGLCHHIETVDDDLDGLCDAILPHLADPVIDSSCFPTWQVCRLARTGVTVALAGDGGDELFGGYETLRAQQLADRWQQLPALLRAPVEGLARRLPPRPAKKGWINTARRFAEGLAYDRRLGHTRWRCFADAETVSRFLAPSLLTPLGGLGTLDELIAEPILHLDEPDRGTLGRHLAIDLRGQLVDALLAKVDRMSMASSLEIRVPLLDLELVELAQRLPDHLRLHRGRSKIALRAIAARHVPRSAVDRPKEGFSAPLKHWLRGPLRDRMETLLDDDRLRRGGLLNPDTVRRWIAEHLAGRSDHAHPLWAAMVIEDWRERWGVSW